MARGSGLQGVPGQRVPLKIGVMGSAATDHPAEHRQKSCQLGAAIAAQGCVTITGACPGLPLAAAQGATEAGGLVIGISPGLSLDEHVYKYRSPAEFHDVLIFTGSGLMGREVVIDELLEVYRTEHFRHPSCFCMSCETSDSEPGLATVRDPVCGMWLDPATAVASREVGGQTSWFCCAACAAAFDKDPSRYLSHT